MICDEIGNRLMSTVIFKTGADSFFWGPTEYSRGTYASYAGMNRDTKSFTCQVKYECVNKGGREGVCVHENE